MIDIDHCQKDDSDEKVLRGSASLTLERKDASAKSVLLDVNKLKVILITSTRKQ